MSKNITKLFNLKGALVDKVEIKKDILVSIRNPRVKAKCPRCDMVCKKIHQKKIRKVVHGIFNEKRIVLLIKVRRFKCKKCCCPFTEKNIPGITNRRYSEQFQLNTISDLRDSSFKSVALRYKVSIPTLLEFLKERKKEIMWAEKGEIILNIDEHSYSGRNMKITIGDVKRKRLIAVLKDRRQKTLRKFLRNAPDSVKQRISEVCIDMCHSYKTVIEEELPNAKIVADCFHVIREISRQMDEMRKIIQESGRRGKRINRFPQQNNQRFY